MTTEYLRSAFVCAFAFVALALASGCNPPTRMRVTLDGAPAGGAEVYANNSRIGQTDSSGFLEVPQRLDPGTLLVARKQVFELPGWRPNHGPENGGMSWTERVYLTNMEVTESGVLRAQTITDPAAEQNLVLQRNNALIGVHILVSVIWDASPAELQDVGERFRQAGEFLYNATDGQIHFEQVDIVDDNNSWRDAEYHWHADNNVWPNCWSLRGLFTPNAFGSSVEMSRRADLLSDFKTIAHEFGHLGFGLMDEYMPAVAYCTNRSRVDPGVNIGPNPAFWANGTKASCVMDNQWRTNKYCSNHRDNRHTDYALEAENCWSVIARGFSDASARWTIRTPETRGSIVDQVQPGLPPQWQARINIDNRTAPGSASLCQPFTLNARWGDGSPGIGWSVSLAVGGRQITEGPTDNSGNVSIVGAHPGDRIWIGTFGPWKNVVATGTNTCNAS